MTEPAIPEASTSTCYRHPDRPTGLRCSNCERPICGVCAVQATVGQFCPECARGRGAQRVIPTRPRTAGRLRQAAPVTFTIIVVAVAVFVLTEFTTPDLQDRLLFTFAQINFLVGAGEWWRIFTPILLHGSVAHIGFNMYALYQLGPAVEVRYGKLNFLALYLSAAAAGGAFAFHFGSREDVLIGASGAIFGLFGLWLDAAYRRRDTAFGRNLLSSLWVSLALNIALPFLLPGISWQGHLGGLLAGILIGETWARSRGAVYWVTPVLVALLAVTTVVV